MKILWPARIAVVLFLAALCLSVRCLALPVQDLLARAWSPGSDARQQSVLALIQTRDGYLWVGTGKGLLRFDGVSFTAFTTENTPGMAGDNIAFDALWEDHAGVLWIGTADNGVVRNDHGHFTSLGTEQGLPGSRVFRIDGDAAGAVWIFTNGGVVRWQGGRMERMRGNALVPHAESRTPDFDVMGVWRRTPAGIERFSYGTWRLFPAPAGEKVPFENDLRSIYEDRLHRVWYGLKSQSGTYFCVQDGALTRFPGLPKDAFVSYQDRAGFLWMNDHGAHPARWKDGRRYPLPKLHTASLLNVLEDSNGVVWAGSFHTDLVQYRAKLIATIQTAGTPEEGSVLFRQRNGVIWAGGTRLLQLNGDRSTVSLQLSSNPREWDVVRTLSEDAFGRLLIGTAHQPNGRLLDHGTLRQYLPDDPSRGAIRALLRTSAGEQWIGTDRGIFRYSSEQAKGKPELVLEDQNVHCLTEGPQHTIWVGTATGLLRFRDGHQLAMPAGAAWIYGEVFGVAQNADGELWIATSGHGIVRFADDAFSPFGTADGLPTSTAYNVTFDARGDLWIRSDVGLLRIRKQSIRSAASAAGKLQVMLLDGADGLPASDMTPPGDQGSLVPNNDTLWFSTPHGIASLHPADFTYETTVPRAVLEEHTIDQSARVSGANFVLRPGQNNLELHYTALGSRQPEQLTFRYRMRGYDRGWTAAGPRRVAYYTQLPSGRYTFEVQAANGDDEDWGGTAAIATIRVLTPFYQSGWMKVLLSILLVVTLVTVLEVRRRISAERTRSRQAFTHKLITTQEGERKRIAHELHDSLGQHLVLIRTLALLSKTSRIAPSDDHLTRIADQAAIAIQEVEHIAYDLRPYQLDRLGLTRAIVSLLHTFESSSPAHLTHTIDNIDNLLPKDLEINLYRIVQEALGNVLKHAEASEVNVTIARTSSSLRMVIADNGHGFMSSASGSNRNSLGLIGIEERAEALGGHAVIESTDRIGTTVTVMLTRMSAVHGRQE